MSGADDFRALFGRSRVSRFLPEGGYGLPQQSRPAGYDIIEGSGFIADGSVYDGSFAASIDPVLLRTTATLTNADAIANPFRVAFNTTNSKLYRSDGATWTVAVDGGDLIAASVIAGKVAAGAISTTELAALAVTAEKIAVGAIRVGQVADDFGNLCPNSGFEDRTGNTIDTFGSAIAGWPFSSHALISAIGSTAAAAKYGSSRLVIKQTGNGTARFVRSDFARMAGGRRLRFRFWIRGETGNNAAAAGRAEVEFYDQSQTYISSLGTGSATVGTSLVWVEKTATVVVPTNAAYFRILAQNDATSATNDQVCFDGFETYYADDDVSHAAGKVLIDSSGVTITDGALTVTNSGSTVIIDGTSNMFKIMATGTMTRAFPSTGTGLAETDVTVAGTGTTPRPVVWALGIDNSAVGNLRSQGYAEVIPNGDGRTFYRAYGYNYAVSTNHVVLAAQSALLNPGTTSMARYYMLVEAGI